MENITLGELADTLKWIVTIDELDVHECKNFLVRFLVDVERGQKIDEVRLIK